MSVVHCQLLGNREDRERNSYPLPITHYPLPITHYPLPITHSLVNLNTCW
ncbi:hypothetical protein [Dolichospermum flos-aquae]|uniref:Uncharacterized protein n=1 Tax=Dolichospermum flos-aquae CCAP 1403/13F TaxID=315271 RepID=A0A6H2BUG1_DOLFA|nr:hypothetical protein [Dolichospermum flos-aquae]QJB42867.1 hypothetical protein HGD76_21700 [Dolichospermum flos-aquae CCAP 1403/13F]